MFLTISTTHRPATDLGYLLHKNPSRVYSRRESFGVVQVFYPVASEERCTAALYIDVDAVGLVRGRGGSGSGPMDQYVNDRPYAASSLLSVAIAETFGSALGGRSKDRPELAETPIPLQFALPALPCRGDAALLRALFEPLGYEVDAKRLELDSRFPAWGESSYLNVTLTVTATLQSALSHLYVLIPVLDNAKHYWIEEDEVEKLLRRGGSWLNSHPEKELIAHRYLKRRRHLTDMALERLLNAEDGAEPSTADGPSVEEREQALERTISLNDQRMSAVVREVESLRAASVIDLGCGEGRLLRQLLPLQSLARVTGVDVSVRALEIARERLDTDRQPQLLRDKLTLLHGSLTYRDRRFEGYDVATVVEVIEHLDETRLATFARVLFEFARPRAVIMTTPNREFNARFANLAAGEFRHLDHRFEWTRAQFEGWARAQAEQFRYEVRFESVGEVDAELGPPTQMAIFTLEQQDGKAS
jgi:3' terminal RNA ribose 2'-O-methyltransferase Hen1